MKVKLVLEIDFDPWFSDGEMPKNKEEWAEFFYNYYMPDTQCIGIDDDSQKMISLNFNEIKELEILE